MSSVGGIAARALEAARPGGAVRMAGVALAVRVLGAALVYLSQIALARALGPAAFGLYIFVWTCVLLAGDLVHLGLGYAAQRFVAEYRRRAALDLLRGFLLGAPLLVLGAATTLALLAFGAIRLAAPWLEGPVAAGLALACLAVPLWGLGNLFDGVARSFDWPLLALVPPYIVRPVLLLVLTLLAIRLGWPAEAATALTAAVAATWAAAIGQGLLLRARLRREVARGPHAYEPRRWLAVSLPMFGTMAFAVLTSTTDVIVLQLVRTSAEVGLYFVAAKTLLLVAFLQFAALAAVGHRLADLHVAHDVHGLRALVRRTTAMVFWPSLVGVAVLLALGPLLLSLFGSGYREGYPVMLVLSLAALAKAWAGPAERLLNMAGRQRQCMAIFAAVFAANVAACVPLAYAFGPVGAAAALSLASVLEAVLLRRAASGLLAALDAQTSAP
jgi:O-antigen/teichoic acid export membrane protein